MSVLERLLLASAVALFGVGAGTAAVRSGRGHSAASAVTHVTTTVTTAPGSAKSPPTTGKPSSAPDSTTVPEAGGPPGPGTADLENGLVTPTDMGGYYRVDPASATAVLDSSPCLAVFQASVAQSGRAVTALLGPNAHSVPMFVEVVQSYPGATAADVYRNIVTALGGCPQLGFDFGGGMVQAPVSHVAIPPVGDSDHVWSGTFEYSGQSFSAEIGVVLTGRSVLGLLWVDTVPPSPAIMGNFTSTLSLAIGKLA